MQPPRRGAAKKERSRDSLDIGAVLIFYGASSIPHGSGWTKMKCPIHGERKASATVNVEEDAFMCFSCGAKGDSIAIIRLQEGCGYLDALVKYKEITGQEVRGHQSSRRNNERPEATESKSYEATGYLASFLRKGN